MRLSLFQRYCAVKVDQDECLPHLIGLVSLP